MLFPAQIAFGKHNFSAAFLPNFVMFQFYTQKIEGISQKLLTKRKDSCFCGHFYDGNFRKVPQLESDPKDQNCEMY